MRVRFEVLTAAVVKIIVFRCDTPRNLADGYHIQMSIAPQQLRIVSHVLVAFLTEVVSIMSSLNTVTPCICTFLQTRVIGCSQPSQSGNLPVVNKCFKMTLVVRWMLQSLSVHVTACREYGL